MNRKPNKRLIDAVYNYCNVHSRRLSEHYVHAVTKHRCFCDALFDERRWRSDGGPGNHLDFARALCKSRKRAGRLDFLDLADCEIAEMFDAYAKGDKAQAVEECYDTIAVLLRAVDVIEGRQAVGKAVKHGK